MSNIQEDIIEYMKLKNLMREEERIIFRNSLLEKHINVVYYYIKNYVTSDNYIDDVKQELFLTFLQCVDLYKEDTGYPFMTYLYFKFKTKISRFGNTKLIIRPFVHVQNEMRKYNECLKKHPKSGVEDICKMYGLNYNYVRAGLKPRKCYSLDAPLNTEEDNGATLIDILGSDEETIMHPEKRAIINEKKRLILKQIARILPVDDFKIFYDYFYVYETNAKRVSEKYGVTGTTIQNTLNDCFSVLRNNKNLFRKFLYRPRPVDIRVWHND